MTQITSTANGLVEARAKPDKMVTLACKKCRMALYMSERELQMPTWRCPSCGTITKTIKPT
jgi:rubrerythrin